MLTSDHRLTLFALLVAAAALLVPIPALSDSSTASNVSIQETTQLNLTAFNSTPTSIYLGQSLSFYTTARNTGNLNVTNFTLEVNTTPGGGSLQRNYTGTIVPGQNVTVIIADYTPAAVGSYNSTALIYYNGSLQTNQMSLSFVVLSVPTTPPPSAVVSGGGGGGGGYGGITYVVVPPEKPQVPQKPEAPPGSADFASFPILVEQFLGETKTISFLVKNPWLYLITNNVSVTGVPAEWLTISNKYTILNPGESKYITVTIEVPEDAFTGDYSMTFGIGDNAVVSVVRPKYYNRYQSEPSVTRTVYVNYELGKTRVQLVVRNGGQLKRTIEVIEDVPKQLAASAKSIEFLAGTPQVVKDDPLLMWKLEGLEPGEASTISYRLPAIPRDFSIFVYMRVHQLNVILEKLMEKIKILELKVPNLFPGKSALLYFSLQNVHDSGQDLNVSLEMLGAGDWKIEPKMVGMRLEPGSVKAVVVSFVTPVDRFFGVQPATITVASAEGWSEKTAVLFPIGLGFLEGISLSLSGIGLATIAAAFVLLAGSALLFWRSLRRRREMHRIGEMYLTRARSDIFKRLVIRGKHGE